MLSMSGSANWTSAFAEIFRASAIASRPGALGTASTTNLAARNAVGCCTIFSQSVENGPSLIRRHAVFELNGNLAGGNLMSGCSGWARRITA
jgi:hypothetical protein